MIRILGTNLLSKKKLHIALTSIYGVGMSRSKKILKDLSISENKKVCDLNDKELIALRELLESELYMLEGNLKRFVSQNIKHLIEINSLRGKRHARQLPVRGQRTRTNAQTARMRKMSLKSKNQ